MCVVAVDSQSETVLDWKFSGGGRVKSDVQTELRKGRDSPMTLAIKYHISHNLVSLVYFIKSLTWSKLRVCGSNTLSHPLTTIAREVAVIEFVAS